MCAAVATLLTLAAYFPYITYAAPAIAGLTFLVLVIELDCRWALASFLASLVPVLLLAEPEAKLLYLFFFGWYPIAKAKIEAINKNAIEWPLKVGIFNICVVLVYFVLSALTSITVKEIGFFGRYSIYALWAFGNVVFLLYDLAISQTATFFTTRLHPQIRKLFKIK